MKTLSPLPYAAGTVHDRLAALKHDGSTANRMIADYLLRNPVWAASATIQELSAAIGVSAATLSRFARLAGLRSYAELRRASAEAPHVAGQPAAKLRSVLERANGLQSPIAQGLEVTLANTSACAEALDANLLAECAERIAEARCVYVMGFGLSAFTAGMLALGMQPFCRNLVNVAEFGGSENAASRLMNIEADDCLVAISIPRYAEAAVQFCHYARDRKAWVIAITDAASSPIMPLADACLLGPCGHPVMANSTVAAVMVAEALTTALMVSRPGNVEQAAKLGNAIAGYLYGGKPRWPAGR